MIDHQTKLILKTQLYENFARIGKAMGNARRLEILDLLAQAEHSVESLAEKTELSIASVSQHLQTLKGARLVALRKEGTYVFYRLASQEVLNAWYAVSELAQTQLLEIDKLMSDYFEERLTVENVSLEDFLKYLQDDQYVIIDARPNDEYRAGHVPSAISVPLDEVDTAIQNIYQDKKIIAYCRTSYCLLSDELALILLSKGYSVKRLEMGMSGWAAAGLPIEKEDGA